MNQVRRYPNYTDVLIIGGGIAGIMAAFAARRRGATVVLACASRLEQAGDTALASGGFGVAKNEKAGDSPEAHYADTLQSGAGLCTPEVVDTVVTQAPELLDELVRYGCNFAREEDGELAYKSIPGHSYPRSVRSQGGGTGAVMEALIHNLRQQDIFVYEHLFATELLKSSSPTEGTDKISGAKFIHTAHGDSIIIHASAVVLATGGLGRLYKHTSNNSDVFGSGYALALEAGCSLTDLEFVQFTPTALIYPEFAAGLSPGGALMAQPGVALLNGSGERFMRRYEPSQLENTTRDVLSRAIVTEVKEGRASEHGGVYLDLSGTTRHAISDISGRFLRAMDSGGVDPWETMVELYPETHFAMGGIPTDEYGNSEVTGLFVAGEVAAGMHGANRLNSNALTEAAVMGSVSGRSAASYSLSVAQRTSSSPARPPSDEVRRTPNAINGPGCEHASTFNVATGSGLEVELQHSMRRIVHASAGVIRSETALREGLQATESVAKELDNLVHSHPPDAQTIATRQILLATRALLLSSLERNESRGAHYRSDFPATSSGAPVHTVVSGTDEATLSVRQHEGSLRSLVVEREWQTHSSAGLTM